MSLRKEISILTRKLQALTKQRERLAPKWEELSQAIESVQLEIATKLDIPMTAKCAAPIAPRAISRYGRMIELLTNSDKPLTISEVAIHLGDSYAVTAVQLHQLARDGRISKPSRGLYWRKEND